jgi:hypothetical protein
MKRFLLLFAFVFTLAPLSPLLANETAVPEGIRYKLLHKITGEVLDATTAGNVSLNPWNRGDYQRWTFVANMDDRTFRIVHKITGQVLDATSAGKVSLNPWNGGDYQRWKLVLNSEDRTLRIVHKKTNLALDANTGGEVYLNQWNNTDFQRWKIQAAQIKYNFRQLDIFYDNVRPLTTRKVDILSHHVIKNNTLASITERVRYSIKKTNVYEYHVTQTLTKGASMTISADLPLGASVEAGLNFEMSMEKGQSWSTSKEMEYGFKQEYNLNVRSAIEVNATMDWVDNYRTPFTITVQTTAEGDTIFGNNTPLSSAQMAYALYSGGEFTGEIADMSLPYELRIKIRGEFIGSYGMNTEVEAHEIPFF